ncbi:MAG: hypothetical protein ACTHQQ_02890, partial [Solirubrobacteraceae bacterium]
MAALRHAVSGIPIAALLAAVVILPRRAAFDRLARLRWRGWAAILPATILIGTLGPLAIPPLAHALVLLAAVTIPVLAVAAALFVVRRLLLVTIVSFAAACGVIMHGAWIAQLGPSLMAALGCLSIGVALARLIPGRWLLPGVAAMAAVDAALLASG